MPDATVRSWADAKRGLPVRKACGFVPGLELFGRCAAQPALRRRQQGERCQGCRYKPQDLRRRWEQGRKRWQDIGPRHRRFLAQWTIGRRIALAGLRKRGMVTRYGGDCTGLPDEMQVRLDRGGLDQQAKQQQGEEGLGPSAPACSTAHGTSRDSARGPVNARPESHSLAAIPAIACCDTAYHYVVNTTVASGWPDATKRIELYSAPNGGYRARLPFTSLVQPRRR